MKYISFIIILIVIIIVSCEKEANEKEIDPFLTWEIGFDYYNNWNGNTDYYFTMNANGDIVLKSLIHLRPKNNDWVRVIIERKILEKKTMIELVRNNMLAGYLPTDSGNIHIKNIDFFYYKYSYQYLYDQYFFIHDYLGYEILFRAENKKLYNLYIDDFTNLLNSIYIK